MDTLAQLESYSNDLAIAVKDLATHSQISSTQYDLHGAPRSNPALDAFATTNEQVERAITRIFSSATKIRVLVQGPTEFLKQLATQGEILACIRWFGEFQILACIPLDRSASITDVAELSSVPEGLLSRIVRLTATVGFLSEPQPGHVAHTSLSGSFVSDPSFLDAGMFLADSAMPAALKMATATQKFAGSDSPTETAWNIHAALDQPFHVVRRQKPKLNRQHSSYLRHAAGVHTDEEVVALLSKLNWSRLWNPSIVEVGAQSMKMAQGLANLHPGLKIVVQIKNTPSSTATATLLTDRHLLGPASDDTATTTTPTPTPTPAASKRITVMTCAADARQSVANAAVYILHLPPSRNLLQAQIKEYMEVLRASSGVMILLTFRLLPEPCTRSADGYDPDTESVARGRDLSMLQLANESEMEMAEVLDVIDLARDGLGKLVVTDRVRSSKGLVVALVVKHQASANAFQVLGSLSPDIF
ncbi:hypothetical protein BKA65DRAFT_608680 [Rhexocercosporidium sp. MPI-PUGE-AT-0058]|nr:hypothetical protein BKA65DRAFT_608680 [Rhexocercosporidium sp. MPI-PUGE-AT-0058]